MITIHKASFVSELSQRWARKQQQHRSSLPTCTKHIPAQCHTSAIPLSLAQVLNCQEAPVHQVMLSLQRLLLKVQIVGSCRGAEALRVHSNELMG